jgi:hypothetical protein
MGGRRGAYRIWWGDLRERGHLKTKRRWMILKWFLKSGMGVIHWIDLAQDRDRWRAVVNAVMNLRVP